MGARIVGTPPPPNGTRFCVIDFPPGNHPHMHRTETVDYVIVIDGEIEMDMDNSTVKLKQGDIMVQRGTNHAWANRSGKHARVAFVLVDARAARHRQAGARHRPARADEEEMPMTRSFATRCLQSPRPLACSRRRGERADLSERPGAADRADLARRRHRHHGAHRRAAADRSSSTRP